MLIANNNNVAMMKALHLNQPTGQTAKDRKGKQIMNLISSHDAGGASEGRLLNPSADAWSPALRGNGGLVSPVRLSQR